MKMNKQAAMKNDKWEMPFLSCTCRLVLPSAPASALALRLPFRVNLLIVPAPLSH